MEQGNLSDWAQALRRRWRTIVIITFTMMLSATLVALWVLPRVYVAEVTLRTAGEGPRLSSLQQYLAGGILPEVQLRGPVGRQYVPIAESRRLAERVEARLGLKDYYQTPTHREAAKRLRESVTAEEHEFFLYLRVRTVGSVRGFSRAKTDVDDLGRAVGADAEARNMVALIANTYAEELQRYLQEESVTTQRRTLAFIRSELRKARMEYKEAMRALQQFQEKHGAVALTESTKALVDAVAQVEREQQMARAALAQATATLQKACERQAAMGMSRGLELPPSTPRLQKLYDEYVTKQTQLALKREELTELHPEVERLRAELAQLDRRIQEEKDRIRLGADEQLDPQLVDLAVNRAGAAARARSLSCTVAAFRARLGTLPALSRELAELELEVKTKQGLLEVLTKEEAQAEIEERRVGTWVQVLDPAIAPDRPVSPRLKLILALAFVVGLMLSITWVLAAESMGPRGGGRIALPDDQGEEPSQRAQ